MFAIPLSLLAGGFLTSPVYDESYYGELYYMYKNIKESEEKKIILIGTSNIAFGIDVDLMQKTFDEDDLCSKLDYKICSFGLYGALGTKIMLDLAKDYIKKDDIVIFAPEFNNQSLSLYFSCEHAWKAMDGHFEMLKYLDKNNKKEMVGSYSKFVSEKYSYLKEDIKAKTNDIYNRSSFNENCNLVYDRKYNEMDGGYDKNALVKLDESIFEQDFVDYVNDYADYVRKQGAQIYYAFSPINVISLEKRYTEEEIYSFYKFIKDSFKFRVIGNINDYIMDQEWFYDSNVHLNSSGAIVRTKQLVEDIKTEYRIDSSSKISIPDKPINTSVQSVGNGDNSQVDYFTYDLKDNGTYEISSSKEELQELEDVIVPYSFNDKLITTISDSVFVNKTNLKSITIQDNIVALNDGMFKNCTNLRRIILNQTSPGRIAVGQELLEGTEDCFIYLPDRETLVSYLNGYFWGHYGAYLRINDGK